MLCQDLGALFLLYTSVGDADGVLDTGKLAEVPAFLQVSSVNARWPHLLSTLGFPTCLFPGKQHWEHCSAMLLAAG